MDLNNEGNVLLLLAAITQHQQMSLLETLFSINQDPSNDALELIAQRINSSTSIVAGWFQARREQQRAQQVAAAVAASSVGQAATASGPGSTSQQALQSLVLSNLMHLEQQQQIQNLPQHQLLQQQLQAAGACQQLLSSSNGANGSNSSLATTNNFYYDYPLSNASSSPPTSIAINQTSHRPGGIGGLSAMNSQHGNNLGANNNNNLDMSPSPPSLHHHQQSHHPHNQAANGPVATSNILAKLTAVTSNLTIPLSGNGQQPQTPLYVSKLDSRMIDLLEALYAINDNPEMGAIEMISKRIGAPCHLITEWFDKKRLKLNPFAGPRSPPVNKKREGGRVVTFSEYQRSLLEAIFNENNYLHPQEYEELSQLIQVPSRNIKIWFKNRRSKQRLSSSTAH